MRTLLIAALLLCVGGCGAMFGKNAPLPTEAPENGGVLRVSRVQGNVSLSGMPMLPASAHSDTCQFTKLGDLGDVCIELDHDGCGKIRMCPQGATE